ncbi:MAG: hypothetical protein JOZ08_15020 [Verrucomicrobia bacterium]|nr:hypothetical protein [Verrucomicrobiota bacterium]
MTKRVALITFEKLPNLSPDDQLLISEFARFGVDAEAAVWSNKSVNWSRYHAAVIRSCWDYHHRHESFLDWLGALQRSGIRILNPPNVIRWNLDKIYLREFEKRGVRIAPTVFFAQSPSSAS